VGPAFASPTLEREPLRDTAFDLRSESCQPASSEESAAWSDNRPDDPTACVVGVRKDRLYVAANTCGACSRSVCDDPCRTPNLSPSGIEAEKGHIATDALADPRDYRHLVCDDPCRTPNLSPSEVEAGKGHITVDELGPRDLQQCPQYQPALDDREAALGLPSNIFAQAHVNGQPMAALVDSGAAVTLIHGRVYDSLPERLRPPLMPPSRTLSTASGGADFAVRGVVQLQIAIAGVAGDVLVTVCDNVCAQCLLGRDFLVKYGVTPCMMDLCVKTSVGATPFRVFHRSVRDGAVCFEAVVHRPRVCAVVPAHSVMRTWVPVLSVMKDSAVLIEPVASAAVRGLLAARSVGRVIDGKVLVQLLNPTGVPMELTDHDEIATFTREFAVLDGSESGVAAVSANGAQCDKTVPADPVAEMPEWNVDALLQQLDLTGSVFAAGQPKHAAFCAFLAEYLTGFAAHADDYGRTSILRHRIETDPHAAPIADTGKPDGS